MRRHPTSFALTALAVLTALAAHLATSGPADAAGKPRAKQAERARAAPDRPKRQAAARPVETMDDIRANDQDPAGNYKAFPSWARSAFTNFSRD